ncbi:hypothetical protein [Nocardioides sp. YIM 152315]|uniref:WXG100-like domain-containing protein n=1 Tax=Nocardioides sp. YIM 152315 TaxID=3031760 RepID=UPI0023DC686F|nr:hypothetical protein [Nocardioides sp. YIM 152315]MDF1602765.1 hypothetical protein [Nocardioides sp. YIM 152315]
MRLVVDGTGYATAEQACVEANHAVALRHQVLVDELAAYAAMAGDAATSADFAAEYDEAACAAVSALTDVAEALTTVGRLTHASLANHHRAEQRSVLPGAIVYEGGDLPDHATYAAVLPATPPSCLGGDPSALPGELAWILDQVESFVWPDADVDKLRAAADTWRTAATGLEPVVDHCDAVIAALHEERSPEIPVAIDVVRDLKGLVCDAAEQYATIGAACEDYADQVEEQHAAILELLHDLVRDTVIIAGVGAALSVLTAGGSVAAATAATAARIGEAAPKLKVLVDLVRAAAAVSAAAIRTVGATLAHVRDGLARFKDVVIASDARALTMAARRLEGTKDLSYAVSVQRQARHVRGTSEWSTGRGGYFSSELEAQQVLDAVHDGLATILGRNAQGHLVVRYDGVTGFNNNVGAGFIDQPSHVFLIKGSAHPSVVPTSPLFRLR